MCFFSFLQIFFNEQSNFPKKGGVRVSSRNLFCQYFRYFVLPMQAFVEILQLVLPVLPKGLPNNEESKDYCKADHNNIFNNNISAGHISHLQVYRCY